MDREIDLLSLCGIISAKEESQMTSTSAVDAICVHPKKLQSSPFNPRKKLDLDKDFLASVKSRGIVTPLLVRKSGKAFEIVSGHRRAAAASKVGITKVPCEVRELSDDDVQWIQLVENLQRTDLDPLDEAEALRNLVDSYEEGEEGVIAEVATEVGRSESYVVRRMQLCHLHAEAKKAFQAGDLTLAAALAISRIPVEKQPEVVEQVRANDDESCWTAKRIVDLCVEHSTLMSRAQFDLNLPVLAADGSEIQACGTCQKRTTAQSLLFEDYGKDDRCTDPGCWRQKSDAHWRDLCLGIEDDPGFEAIPDEVSWADLFTNSFSDRLGVGTKYLDLDEPCYQLDETNKILRRVLGKKQMPSTIYLARDQAGRVHELVLAEDVLEPKEGPSDADRARRKELRQYAKASKLTNTMLSEAVMEQLKGMSDTLGASFWKNLAHASLAGASNHDLKQAIAVRGIDESLDSTLYEQLESWLVNADLVECRALVVELAIGAELAFARHDDKGRQKHSAIVEALAGSLGGKVDTEELVKKAHDVAFGRASKQGSKG